MADQEFLASFGVQIDESGLNRLQLALQQKRELAEALAAAFDKARASVEAFFRDLSERSFTGFDFSPAARVTEEQQGLNIPFSLDFTKATKELAAFFKAAGKALSLNADASGIIAAGQGAFSQLQSLYASRVLRLQAEVTVPEVSVGGSGESNGNSESSGSSESGTSESSSGSTGESSGTSTVAKPAEATQTILQSATGGRFSAPTTTEIAEDGDPEYVIPVRKESLAVPLLRQLIGELSAPARELLQPELAVPARETPQQELIASAKELPQPELSVPSKGPLQQELFASPRELPQPEWTGDSGKAADTRASGDLYFAAPAEKPDNPGRSAKAEPAGDVHVTVSGYAGVAEALAGLPDLLASAKGATTQIVNQQSSNNVSAPVSIQVQASGSDPEAVGKSIYDVTEQYLLRTLNSVMG